MLEKTIPKLISEREKILGKIKEYRESLFGKTIVMPSGARYKITPQGYRRVHGKDEQDKG